MHHAKKWNLLTTKNRLHRGKNSQSVKIKQLERETSIHIWNSLVRKVSQSLQNLAKTFKIIATDFKN